MIHAIMSAVSLAAFTAFVLGAFVADAWILTCSALVRVAAMHALGRFCHFGWYLWETSSFAAARKFAASLIACSRVCGPFGIM